MRRIVALAAATAIAVLGCSANGADETSATKAAVDFYRAFTAHDGGGACALLSEHAAHEVEKSSSASCADGIVDERLPEPGQPVTADVFGEEARVVFDADTLFVTHSDIGWRVAAAGCQARQSEPFDCKIQGG